MTVPPCMRRPACRSALLAELAAVMLAGFHALPGGVAQGREPCPDELRTRHPVPLYPRSCGSVEPPAESLLAPDVEHLEGAWRIALETPDGPVDWIVALGKGLLSVNYRDPAGPWAMTGHLSTYPFEPVVDDGTIRFSAGGYDLTTDYGSGSEVLRGHWTRGDQSGPVTWRKLPAARITSVVFGSGWRDEDGAWVESEATLGGAIGRLVFPEALGCGGMRGNCRKVRIVIRGENLAAPHAIWLDPASRMELLETRFLFDGDRDFSTDGAMKWIVTGEPVTEGISLTFAMWDGVRPGQHVLWLDDQPIPFEIVVPVGDEDGAGPPEISILSADGGFELSQLPVGFPFRVRLDYGRARDDDAVDLALGYLRGDREDATRVTAHRTTAGEGIYLTQVQRAWGMGIPWTVDGHAFLLAEASGARGMVPLVGGATLRFVAETTAADGAEEALRCEVPFHLELDFPSAPRGDGPLEVTLSLGEGRQETIAMSQASHREATYRSGSLVLVPADAVANPAPLSRLLDAGGVYGLVAGFSDGRWIAQASAVRAGPCAADEMLSCALSSARARVGLQELLHRVETAKTWALKKRDIPEEVLHPPAGLWPGAPRSFAASVVDDIIEGRGPDTTLRDVLPRLGEFDRAVVDRVLECGDGSLDFWLAERRALLDRLVARRTELQSTLVELSIDVDMRLVRYLRHLESTPDYNLMELPLDVPYEGDFWVERTGDGLSLAEWWLWVRNTPDLGPVQGRIATLGSWSRRLSIAGAVYGLLESIVNVGILTEISGSLRAELDGYLQTREQVAYLEGLVGFYDRVLVAENELTDAVTNAMGQGCGCR